MEGKNIVIEYRYAEGKPGRLSEFAAELVRLNVDVIVTGGPGPTRASKEATVKIPIVMGLIMTPSARGSSPASHGLEGISQDCPPFRRR